MDTDNAIVHLAANAVVIGDRVIQRCFVCGLKLCDNLGSAAPINADGSNPTFSVWPVGAWIEQEGNRWSVVGQTETPQIEESDVHSGCCLSLVE